MEAVRTWAQDGKTLKRRSMRYENAAKLGSNDVVDISDEKTAMEGTVM